MTRTVLVLALAKGLLVGAVLRAQYEIGSPPYLTAVTHVAVGKDGSIYEVGTTSWPEFPTTPGPLSRFNGPALSSIAGDIFIRKRAADTRQIIFSVLIGGSGYEWSNGAAVDNEGNVYVTGTTDSPDFPFTGSSSQGTTGFVVQLNPAGTSLVYALSIGSFTPGGLALTPDGRVVVVGSTDQRNLPTTENAVQRALTGRFGAYVMRLSAGTIDYATYLGGPGETFAHDVAVDGAGDFYLTGFSAGHSFPTLATSFAPQAPFGGFVSKIDHATGQLIYSTYLPGVSLPPFGAASKLRLTVDSEGHAYVTGPAGAGFPTTSGAFQTEVASNPFVRFPEADAFLLELDASGSRLIFATLFGSDGNDHGRAVAVSGDTVTIAGVSSSWFLPVNDFGLPTCNLPSLFYSLNEPYRSFVASFDHEGKRVTAFTLGYCSEELVTDLQPTPSGRLLMTATTAVTMQQSFLLDIDLQSSLPVQVSAVTDSASIQVGPHAPLEWVTVFGKGLGPRTRLTAQLEAGALPKTLGGTKVMIGGREAPLLAVAEDRVEAVVPQAVSFPFATISVVTAAGTSEPLTTRMQPATPGLFTADGSGIGQGLILNQDGSRNSATNPAQPGSKITVFGTGFGLTNPAYGDGQIVPGIAPLVVSPLVTIGEKGGTVTYAGAAPGLVNGMMQINVTLPMDVELGPTVPIVVRSLPFRSQSGVTVAIE